MQTRKQRYTPAVVWFFILLILLCIPGSELPHVDSWFDRLFVDKWVHAVLFGVLAFLFMRATLRSDISPKEKHQRLLLIAFLTCIWGITTEVIQDKFVKGRAFELLDWAADSVGALIALVYSRSKLSKILQKAR